MDFKSLHDTSLKRVSIDWESSSGILEIDAARPSRVLIEKLLSFNVTRFNPWGPSNQIYEAEMDPGHPLGHWLVMRMQSGDWFEIIADSIRLEEATA